MLFRMERGGDVLVPMGKGWSGQRGRCRPVVDGFSVQMLRSGRMAETVLAPEKNEGENLTQ